MHVNFNTLPEEARIWIYQANEKISMEAKIVIERELQAFAAHWSAHNQPLKASYQIVYDYFLVLAVDESYTGASGCSIDSSVHAIKQIGNNTGIDFFSRTGIPFLINEGVTIIDMKALRQNYEAGIWNSDTLTFNTGISSMKDYRMNWMIRAGDSWLSRFIPLERKAVNE